MQHKKYKDRLEVLHNNDDAIVKVWHYIYFLLSFFTQRFDAMQLYFYLYVLDPSLDKNAFGKE